jgi:plastocyanin
MGDNFFNPANITVTPGTTVCWTNRGQVAHTVTATGGAFNSGNMNPGATFSFTFNTPGSYGYLCAYHPEMVGTVNVTSGAPPPPPAPPPAPPPPPGQLVATVGTNDGTNITLTMNGARVTHLTAGTYVIQVRDNSTFHNFHLSGPGVNMSTEVDFSGTATWTVTFTDGIYRYVCDPHASSMNGTFSVGSAQPPPPPPPPVRKCKVPKVVGKKLPVAKRAITGARCRVGRVRRAWSRTKARGRVVKQTPRAGVRRPRGTRVHLVVSRGRR